MNTRTTAGRSVTNKAEAFKHSPKGKTFIVPHDPERSLLINAVAPMRTSAY